MRAIDSTYGSNEDGLIWGYRFPPGQAAQAIGTDAVPAFLSAQGETPTGEFLWLHFSLSNQGAERYLRRVLDLPEAFFESLGSQVGSTRLEQDDDALIAVIHDVLFESSFDASEVGTTSLCINPRLIVSARLRPLRSVDRLRAAVRAGQPFRSPVELLAHLLRDQANVLSDILRKSTLRVDGIEDRLLANRIASDRTELGSLRRSLVRLQRLMAPEPTALFRLLNRPPAWVGRDDVQDLQQAAEEFSTAIGDSAALVERVKLIQEELAALVNEQTGRSLFVLTVVTVLALPVNLVAGLFGMNVGGVPLSEHGHGFAIVVTALVVLTAVLAYLAFGRNRD
ncbi:transporter [Lysobacter sp. CCNWLW3]|uniref:transporter n=1 Tax=unclassified Lysobacter TaxID=2635362 RepID=UPI002FD44186